jgi:hypothetical protein
MQRKSGVEGVKDEFEAKNYRVFHRIRGGKRITYTLE